MIEINRRNFFEKLKKGALGAFALFWLMRCSSSNSSDPAAGSNSCNGGADLTANIGTNHGHTLIVPNADVVAGVTKNYSIQGAGGHDHIVQVTAADFFQLASGNSVTGIISSADGAGPHAHSIDIICS